MASIGHIAVGMAAARVQREGSVPLPSLSAMAYWSVIALLPDIDFIAFAFGIPYGAPFGHRGATHSLAFAAGAALVISLFSRADGPARARLALTTALVVASHPLLDAMTNHGLGCAWLWPFDNTRFVMPWRIVPTLPSFDALWSPVALRIAASELLVFSPLVVFALWPQRRVW